MMRLALALLALAAALPARAELHVVTTLPDLAALAREVGGDRVTVTALVPPEADAHYLDPRPSLLVPLSKADLLVLAGLELESGWLPPLLVSSRNAGIQPGGKGYLDASTVVHRLGVPTSVDRAQGDIHPGGNPHFTFDPRAARPIVAALAERMAALDPAHAAAYRHSAKHLDLRLAKFAAEQRARFDALPADKRQLIPYHASLIYLTDWLGLTEVTTVEPRPGVAPTPAHVAHVLETIKSRGVGVIAQESYYPKKTSQTLARLSGAELVVLPAGTPADEDYLTHLRGIADALYAALAR